MNKEQQKDEIILSVKKANGVNSYYTEADNFLIDSNDVEHIAEQSAEMLYNAGYRKIDENCAVITKDDLKLYQRQSVKEFADLLKSKTLDETYKNKDFYIHISDIYKMIEDTLKEYEQ